MAYSGTVDSLRVVKDLLKSGDGFTIFEQHWIVLTIFHYATPNEHTLAVANVSTSKMY